MLHTRTCIKQQYLSAAPLSVCLNKRRHQCNNQQRDNKNLQVHKNVMDKLLKKGARLLIFQQLFPKQAGRYQIVRPLWLQKV